MDKGQKTSSSLGGALGALLLLLSLAAVCAGVFGALYLNQLQPPTTTKVATDTPAAPTQQPTIARESQPESPAVRPSESAKPPETMQAPQSSAPPDRTAASPPAVEPPLPSSPAAPPTTTMPPAAPQQQAVAPHEPQGTPPTPPGPQSALPLPDATGIPPGVAQSLARIEPTAGPVANSPAEAGSYWVEYGAYLGAAPAERLVKALSAQQLAAKVTTAPGRHGKRYFRVRSAEILSRQAAEAARDKAAALGLRALLHRAAPTTETPAADTPAAPSEPRQAAATPTARIRYWVQYAAYDHPRPAAREAAKLKARRLDTAVIHRIRADGHRIYYLRSPLLADKNAAEVLAQKAKSLGTPVLIGQTKPHSHAGQAPRGPPHWHGSGKR